MGDNNTKDDNDLKKDNISKKIKDGLLKEKESKKSEYVIAVIANVIIFYIANNIVNWNLSFIAPSFTQVLWAINLAIGIKILGDILLIIYDPSWLRHTTKAVMNVFSFVAAYTFYVIFPLSFSQNWISIFFVLLLILIMIGIVVSTAYELFKLLLGVFYRHSQKG